MNRALKTWKCVPMLSLLDPNKVGALKCLLTPTTPCFMTHAYKYSAAILVGICRKSD